MSPRPCILIPTYHNPRTLEEVVRGAAAQGPLFVVDDGCQDESPQILARLQQELPDLRVLTHPNNRGKGLALQTGMAAALAEGFSHAVTLDSDGQHLPTDITAFFSALATAPDTLWLGARDLAAAGAGKGSRFGCWFSNFWIRVETGYRLPDTQTGFRCYPLAEVCALHLPSRSYDFEVEVLVKAAWAGLHLDSVPIQVRYFQGAERVSHLRPVRDFARISWLNTKLCTMRCCFPAPFLALLVTRKFQALSLGHRLRQGFVELVVKEPGSPRRLAGSVGLGLFFGIAPFWGFQIMLTILFAHLLGASKAVAVVASNISVPVMIPFILYASLVLGRLVLGRETALDAWPDFDQVQAELGAYICGSFLLAAAVALGGAALTLAATHSIRRLRRRGTA